MIALGSSKSEAAMMKRSLKELQARSKHTLMQEEPVAATAKQLG
jgi:hypothetical protein